MSSVIEVKTVNYPESDGKPMGETDEHRDEMVREIELLRRYFEGRPVYVSGNLLFYYVQGDPKKCVVPDVFVVKDTDPKKRRTYKLWIERKTPDAVIEVTSRKTKKKDQVAKPALYRQLRVREYFMFDPTEDYLHPPLQGYRLVGARYVQLKPDDQGGLESRELGLRFQAERGRLMMYRLDTGERLLTAEEARHAADEARRAADEARHAADEARQVAEQARQAAEAEVARLREELRRRG